MDINKLWKTVKTLELTDFEPFFQYYWFQVTHTLFCVR